MKLDKESSEINFWSLTNFIFCDWTFCISLARKPGTGNNAIIAVIPTKALVGESYNTP